jgi:hypothetical protein
MLGSAPNRELWQVVTTADGITASWATARAESEQGLERGHWCPTPVMAKDEFVELDLQLMTADPSVRPDQPLLKIPNGAVGKRHHRLDPLAQIGCWRLHACDVSIARLFQSDILLEAVAMDCRVWRDVLLMNPSNVIA